MTILLSRVSGVNSRIEQFFTSEGRLISIPARSAKRLAVLHRMASVFQPGMKYPEKQLNEMIAEFHPDTAAIRRYMIENGILERDATSTYWLAESR